MERWREGAGGGQKLAGGRDLGTLRNRVGSGWLEGCRGWMVGGLHRLQVSDEVGGGGQGGFGTPLAGK